jgi:hypothetical protein
VAKPLERTAGMIARPFVVQHYVKDVPVDDETSGTVADQWSVIQGRRRRFCTKLTIQVTTTSDDGYRLEGVGCVVTIARGEIVIIP